MSKSHTAASIEETQDSAVRRTEFRAEAAEQKVEQLERTIEELKSHGADATTDANRSVVAHSEDESLEHLRREPMMAHLLNALDERKDIGHYGRLVFAIVSHHFLPPERVLEWLDKDPDFGHDQAIALLRQVSSRDYSPPRRERILAWQAQQDFPILPNPDDPDCGNVYRNLKFPDKVYEHIQEYQEDKIEAHAGDLFPTQSSNSE